MSAEAIEAITGRPATATLDDLIVEWDVAYGINLSEPAHDALRALITKHFVLKESRDG